MKKQMLRAVLFLFSFFILLFSCRRQDDNQTKLNHEYLNKEISDRVQILSKDSSFSKELNTIRKNVENLEYLTIDIENINASIIKSNLYFIEASKTYGVDTSGFILLSKGEPLQDIVTFIKKNHLSLLNKIIISRNKDGVLMYTAQ